MVFGFNTQIKITNSLDTPLTSDTMPTTQSYSDSGMCVEEVDQMEEVGDTDGVFSMEDDVQTRGDENGTTVISALTNNLAMEESRGDSSPVESMLPGVYHTPYSGSPHM